MINISEIVAKTKPISNENRPPSRHHACRVVYFMVGPA